MEVSKFCPNLGNKIFRLLILIILLFIYLPNSNAQCTGFPATVADQDCSGGTPLANNAGVSGGSNYSVCATSTSTLSYSGINLNGGLLRICGNVNLSGNLNSGTIVVSCGSTLNFTSGLTLNSNIKIVNYGTVNVTGDLTFQNSNNSFLNELATSQLNVTGNLTYPQNSNQPAYVKNAGYISVGNNFDAREGGYTCFTNTGIMQTRNIRYMQNCGGPANRFTFGSATGKAIIRYTGSATLNAVFTSSSNWEVQKATGAAQTLNCSSSWGSASIVNNTLAVTATSGTCAINTCFTTLPIELKSFSATNNDNATVVLNWITISEKNNKVFYIERSSDAIKWVILNSIQGEGNSNETTKYTYKDDTPNNGINYYRLRQEDFDGTISFSPIVSISNTMDGLQTSVYPNPASAEEVYLSLHNFGKFNYTIQALSVMGEVLGNQSFVSDTEGEIQMTLPITILKNIQGIIVLLIYREGILVKSHRIQIL